MSRVLTFALLGGLALAGTRPASHARPSRHVALIIGISDYKNFILSGPPGQSDLQGPRNDVELVRAALRSRLFDNPADILILTDSGASKAGIAEGFHWLIERANDPSDIVVVFYSGHGSNTPDLDGDEARVTPGDRRDEALVPWDADDIHDPAQLVVDDQIGHWLDSLATRNVTVIVDACFSGTVTRGGEETDSRPRGPLESIGDTVAVVSNSTGFRTGRGYTLITASSANEVASEKVLGDHGEVYGVLTWFLTQAIRGAGPTARYDELFQAFVPQMKGKSNQTPQLEGDRSALLLSEKQDLPARPFVQVSPAGDGRYRVDEGAIHGVRKAAVYDLFPATETKFTGPALGQLVIDSLGPLESWGRVNAAGNRRFRPRPAGCLPGCPRCAVALERIPVFLEPQAARRAGLSTAFRP